MRLRFAPEEGDAFEEARDGLLDRLEEWLEERGQAPEAVGDVALALDWKWGYGDGDLAAWRPEDVAELLLEWCPRKLSVPQEACRGIPEGLAAFLRFLHASGVAGPGSAPLTALLATIEEVTPEFVESMGDPSRFGMAKSLFSAAAAEGVDFTDADQVDGWMAEFNARPEEQRREVLSDRALGLVEPVAPSRLELPPVAVPSAEEVRESAAAAPVLAMFAALADYVGQGRRLTQTGNLTLADARALVGLMGTGDVVDEVIGTRTFRIRSAAELPVLDLAFRWARKAGVVRVAHGKVMATKKGAALGRDPAASFDRAVRALLEMGPLSAQRDPEGWFAWPEVNALFDELTPLMLSGPYAAQRPLPLDDLAQAAAHIVLQSFRFPSLGDEKVAGIVNRDVTDVMDALALAGVVVRSDTVVDPDRWARRRTGGTVALTPAGVDLVRRLLMEAGCDAPVAGRFAAASAAELLEATDELGFATLMGELEAWRRRRSPEQAAQEMADAARGLDDPALAHLALAVMAEIGVEVSAAAVRRLAEVPGRAGLAACWLVDHGLEPPGTLYDPTDPARFVDVLVHRLVSGGSEVVVETLALAGNHEAQVALLGRLWKVASPATAVVLEAVGKAHPVKAVAKAARKSVLQHRSWLANR